MNTLILYLRTVFLRKSTASFLRKNTRAAGFSILEMTMVLGIMAATSIAGIKVLNGKIEQNAVDRVVADLTLVAEAAYECYVAPNTPNTPNCKNSGGWKTTSASGTASAYLSDNQRSFLPQNFSDNYEVEGITATATEPSKLVIKAVNLPNKRVAQRVAHTFGSLAKVGQAKVGQEKVVEVTLGIPGTENAFSGLKDEIKEEMKTEHFIFTTPGEYNIKNVKDVEANRIIATRITLGGSSGVELTQERVDVLRELTDLKCSSSEFIIKEGGSFKCGSGSGGGSGTYAIAGTSFNLKPLVASICSNPLALAGSSICNQCLQ